MHVEHHWGMAETEWSEGARATVVDRLVDRLIDDIVDGAVAIGAPLPPERELAETFGVNRATIRQAVARLEQIGLVSRRQGSGTVVRDPRALTAPEVVARLGRRDQIALVEDLLEIPEALGHLIGRRAQPNLGPDDVARLRELVDRVTEVEALDVRQDLELAVFAVLVEAGRSRALAAFLAWVSQVYEELAGAGGSRIPFPAFRRPYEDADALRARLARVVDVAEAGGDLGVAVAAHATATADLIRAALRADADGEAGPG